MSGTLGTAILGNTLLDILSTQNCNVATFGNQSSNLLIRLYDSNLPFVGKNYQIGLCNVDSSFSRNALYITANQSNMTRIGIGTAFPASVVEIEGVDSLRIPFGKTSERPTVPKKGQIRYNADLDYFEGYGTGGNWAPIGSGGGATWSVIDVNKPGFVLSSGTFNTTCNIGLQRVGNNDITVQVYIDGRVAVKPTGGADYRINLPSTMNTTSYPISLTLGELWLVTSNINTGAMAEYKALAKSIPGVGEYVSIKYLNGTTESSFGDFNVGQNLTLQGLITYQTTAFYTPSFNSNNILMTGANVEWKTSMAPYPFITAPTGGATTITYKQGIYRYFGDDIIHNVNIQATLDTQPANTDLNYVLDLQWPVNLSQYTSNTIVGEFWLRASYGGIATSYKAYAQTNAANSNMAILRYVNGTYDQSLADIPAGTTITLQGTLTYKTVLFSSVYIPTQYLTNRLYQDADGKVAINNAGALVRARWEVVETSNYPAVIIDQRSGADIAQFRSNETEIKAIIDAKGNVGIGTSMAPHPMTVWGGMMFNGTMYDIYGNPLWIPGSSVNWQTTPTLPTISVPTGGTWVANTALTSGAWRYIGNEVNYNVAITGTMTVAPTNTAENFKLSLPAPLRLATYAAVPGGAMSNIILGELWANIAYGTNSNMFKSYAMVDPSNSNVVALRVLSGTTDTTFSTMTAPSVLTLRGQINYTTTSNIVTLSLPSTGVPANFKQDQYGRVSLNTNNPPRGQFDIVLNSNVPGLVVDQAGTGDLVQLMDYGIVKTVVDASGNVGIGTTVAPEALNVVGNTTITGDFTAKNMSMFRNRIINGDMRIDQRGGGGSVGAGAGSSSAGMTTVYSLDRWAIALGPASGTLCAAQTTLSATDQAAVGGVFTNAAVVGVAPATGLDAYYPFDGNVNDASGNGYNLTTVGSMSYVSGRVGSNAVYLANEGNVLSTPTKASNQLTTTYSIINPITVSFWMLITKCVFTGYISTVFSFGTTTIEYLSIQKNYSSATASTINVSAGSGTSSSTVNINTWYHIAAIWTPSTNASLYVNGTLIGTTTTSITSSLINGTVIIGDHVRSDLIRPFAGFIDDFRIYNRALSATEIAALAGIAPIQVAPATTVASGLTTRLTFDNTTADAQGTLPAPTATGTTVYSSLSKSGTRSLDLTANTAGSSTITTALSYAYTANTLPLTVSCWINTNTIGVNYQMPVSTSPNGSTTGWCISINSTGLYGFLTIGGIEYATTEFPIVSNTWYHVSMTANYNNYTLLYINGVQARTSRIIPSSGTMGSITFLRVGSMTSALYAYKGYIDDVRIYNRALSPQEVAGLYYSYTPSPYVLYQQPIEGLNVADLGWGTTAAQPATVSAWIKNNTASAQQFSLSAGNAGAAAAISVITFESGIEDTLGFLTNPVGTNVVYSTSVNKVGTRSLDLTANTAGGTATTYMIYTMLPLNIPISISFWIYPLAYTGGVVMTSIGSTGGDWSYNGNINSSGQVYFDAYISGVNYSTPQSSATAITLNTWTHVCSTITVGGSHIIYMNGIRVSSISISTGTLLQGSSGGQQTIFNIGRQNARPTTTAYRGYIDDVRIFNRDLSAAEVYQLYTKNAGSITTISQFLLPRSYLYTTPSIPANTWQKISFTIPGDTTDAAWAKDTTCGLNLALCLGAGGVYVSSGTSGWASAEYATGSSVQVFGGSATNFLAGAGNSIYITGVQLERGTLMTPFEFRPSSVELQLCQRYYQQYTLYYLGLAYNVNFGYSHGLPLKQIMRAIPSLQSGATFTVDPGTSAGTPAIYTATTEIVTVWNPTNNWSATTQLRFTGGFNAEL